ncbi:MAG: hypothetical protein P1Q69_02540, partial [Candidatus Thorarchaeota archaeon]|nr:hypothetical protein [Candidatus Thorarchaeota archaeon]
TIVVLAIALSIYLLVLFTRNDFIFAGVGVWSLIGVLGTLLSVTQPEVMLVTSLGLIILVVAMLGWFIIGVRRETFSVLSKIHS